jgi:HSP20 family molecular chaperone IbpA
MSPLSSDDYDINSKHSRKHNNKDDNNKSRGKNILLPEKYDIFFKYLNSLQDFSDINVHSISDTDFSLSHPQPWQLKPAFNVIYKITDERRVYKILEDDDTYRIEMEIHGFKKEKLKVSATRNSITISNNLIKKVPDEDIKYSLKPYKPISVITPKYQVIRLPKIIHPSPFSVRMRGDIIEVTVKKKKLVNANSDLTKEKLVVKKIFESSIPKLEEIERNFTLNKSVNVEDLDFIDEIRRKVLNNGNDKDLSSDLLFRSQKILLDHFNNQLNKINKNINKKGSETRDDNQEKMFLFHLICRIEQNDSRSLCELGK